MEFESQFPLFPFGTQYYREPTPLPAEWEGDLREISRVGYTHIQLRPQWICHERIRGRESWDDIDQLFELAHKYHLKVILKPMMECAPDWVYSELNGYRIGFGGEHIAPEAHGAFYAGGWLPCFDNPQVREAASQFVQHMAERYREHPAMWFYNAWNEPRSRPLGQCQCEHSVSSYRKWLQQRFGSIDQLNTALGKYWMSYDTLNPPQTAWDHVQMYLWRQWAADAVASHVKLVADAIKHSDPKAFVMTHVGCCSVIQDPCCDASDDLANARMVDRYGTSFPVNLHPKSIAANGGGDLISDWLRRVDANYWCHEFYTNEGNWSVPPSPEVLNRLVWLAISGGTAGFTFWQYRSERVGNETNGYGMRNIDGSPTGRSRVCVGIAEILRTKGADLVDTYRANSSVKLLYNRPSDVMARVQSLTQNEVLLLGNCLENGGGSFYKQALHGAHRAYLLAGECVDFVVPGDTLHSDDLLHVTADEMCDQATAEWLMQFVADGGRLVVEMPFACRDANTWVSVARPNHSLERLLGCTELERIQSRHLAADTVTFNDGTQITASHWKIGLQLTDGQVLATWADGTAAVVLNRYGKGRVLSCGINLSMASGERPDDPAILTMHRLIGEHLGVVIGVCKLPAGVWVRRRLAEDREVWFVFNLTNDVQQVNLACTPADVWQDGGCTLTGCCLSMPPQVTWVARMR